MHNSPSHWPPASVPRNHNDVIDEYVQTEIRRQDIPGVAIGIFKNGKVLRAQGHGLANLEHQVPVKPETVFQTASIGKMFTAIAVMLLVEDSKLSLDAPLTRYLPDAPTGWKAITLRHLLNHTSGIGEPDLDFKQDYGDDELLRLIHASKPEFEPGRRWSYSNAGYIAAGIIIGKACGQHYGQVLRQRVFEPSGMRTARLLSHIDIVPNRASGYEPAPTSACEHRARRRGARSTLKNQDWVSASLNQTADGGLQMSVLDFARWDGVVARRGLLKHQSWRQVFSPAPLNDGTCHAYGFGWELPRQDPLDAAAGVPRFIGHNGAWQGFCSDYRRDDANGLSFVVLANASHADAEGLLQGIAERFDKRYQHPPETATADPASS